MSSETEQLRERSAEAGGSSPNAGGASGTPVSVEVRGAIGDGVESGRQSARRILARKYKDAKLKIRLLRAGLVVACVVTALSIAASAALVASARNDVGHAAFLASQAEERADRLQRKLEAQQHALDALMRGRIDGLHSLDYERSLEVGHPAIRNVRFTRLDFGDRARLGYRLVVQNPMDAFVVTDLEIILFDRRGFELQAIPIRPGRGEHTIETLGLWGGDVRTVVGEIGIAEGGDPAHFVLRFAPDSPLADVQASLRPLFE